MEFVGGQNPTTPSPIITQFFTPVMQWQGLNTTVLIPVIPVDRFWRLIAQMTLLGIRYTGEVEKCYNFVFSHKPLPLCFESISNGEIDS